MKGKFINKPLFGLQRKSTKNLLIGFAVIIAVLLFGIVVLYPVVGKAFEQMPAELRDILTFNGIADYFNTEALEIWVLLVGIFVAVMAINITTKEFKNGSYELIYTLNMSRGEIVRTKLLRLIVNTLYINLVSFIASLVSLLIFGFNEFKVVNLIVYALFATLVTLQVAVLVFSLGLLNKNKFSTAGGVIVVVVMYLFTTFSMVGSDNSTKWLGYLSPLSTMRGSIMTNGFKGVFTDGILFAVWSVISLLLLFISAKKFENDDLC